MESSEQPTFQKMQLAQNADLEYIIEMFNNEELGLTISQARQESQRSSRVSRYESSLDFKEEITDDKYRGAFITFFKNYRKEAVEFIDSAIRFMNSIRKMKLKDLLQELSKENVFQTMCECLVTPELLVEPIQEELASGNLSQKDVKIYEQALKILQQKEQLSIESKIKIQELLAQVQSH